MSRLPLRVVAPTLKDLSNWPGGREGYVVLQILLTFASTNCEDFMTDGVSLRDALMVALQRMQVAAEVET